MKAQIEQRDKEKVKSKQIVLKEEIKKTRDDLTENLKTLRAQLRGNRKKYTEVELENKQDRIQKLQENIDILFEMFEFQNKEQQRKLLGESNVGVQIDIESQMMFKKKQANGASGGVKFEGFKQAGANSINNNETGEEREISEFEKECLAKFQQNDEEIDAMLDVVMEWVQHHTTTLAEQFHLKFEHV